MSVWEEIRQLQNQLDSVQFSDHFSHRLTEHNCVELVSTLCKLNLLDLLYSLDGKELITWPHLRKSVWDELEVCNGRSKLVDLSERLNIDVEHIEEAISDLSQTFELEPFDEMYVRRKIVIRAGEAITSTFFTYLTDTCIEMLKHAGSMYFTDIAKLHDLPVNLVSTILKDSLSRNTEVLVSDESVYTKKFLTGEEAKIRGCLVAICKPTPLSIIQNFSGVSSSFDSLIKSVVSNMNGECVGSIYIPSCWPAIRDKIVMQLVERHSVLTNGMLSKAGIQDSNLDLCESHNLLRLSSSWVRPDIKLVIDSAVNEVISSGEFCDLCSQLPSMLSATDVEHIFTLCKEDNSSWEDEVVLVDNVFVVAIQFLNNLLDKFIEEMPRKASDEVKTKLNEVQNAFERQAMAKVKAVARVDRKDNRKKKSAQTTHGSSQTASFSGQGREIKTKKVQKKYRLQQKIASDSEEDREENEMEYMSEQVLFNKLNDSIECHNEDFLRSFVKLIKPKIDAKYSECLHEAMNKAIQENAARKAVDGINLTASQLQDVLKNSMFSLSLYQKGLQNLGFLPSSILSGLENNYIKAIGTTVANYLFTLVALDYNINLDPNTATFSQLRELLPKIKKEEYSKTLEKVLDALSKSSLPNFTNAVLESCEECNIYIGKLDKKREKTLTNSMIEDFKTKLQASSKPDQIIILVLQLLCWQLCKAHVLIPGKLVLAILSSLEEKLEPNKFTVIQKFHRLVVISLQSSSTEEDDELLEASNELNALIPEVKLLVLRK